MPLTPKEMPNEMGFGTLTGNSQPTTEHKLVIGSYSIVFEHFQKYLQGLQLGNDQTLSLLADQLTSNQFTSFENLYKTKLDGAFAHGFRQCLKLIEQELQDLHVEHKEVEQ